MSCVHEPSRALAHIIWFVPIAKWTRKERQRGAPVNEERKKQGHLVPAPVLTPNTLAPC